MRAFLALYAAELPAASAAALTDFWLAWNHGVGIEPAWRALLANALRWPNTPGAGRRNWRNVTRLPSIWRVLRKSFYNHAFSQISGRVAAAHYQNCKQDIQ